MRRPRALDLCCCAGGVSKGLHLAGFDVTGVDTEPQPNYPYRFIQADAMAYPLDGFDFVWASPPCQKYAWGAKRWKKNHPDLVAPMRDKLNAWGGPWIMENVIGSPIQTAVVLCGLMFGLGVIRHRLFESNKLLFGLDHPRHTGSVRGGDYVTVAGHGGDGRRGVKLWQRAMGIDWMTEYELTQAIPPAYSEFLGRQMLVWCDVETRRAA